MEQMDGIDFGDGVSGFHDSGKEQGCVLWFCRSTIDFQYSHVTCMNFFKFSL